MMVNKAGSIKNDMVMNMILVNMGTDDIFIFSLLVLRQQILCRAYVRFQRQPLQA